jgi:hypothetical protein
MWPVLYCFELSVLNHSQQNLLSNHELRYWVPVTSLALQSNRCGSIAGLVMFAGHDLLAVWGQHCSASALSCAVRLQSLHRMHGFCDCTLIAISAG